MLQVSKKISVNFNNCTKKNAYHNNKICNVFKLWKYFIIVY